MKILCMLFLYTFVLFASPAEAIVAQSASSALRGDFFPDSGSSSSSKSKVNSSSKQADKKKQIEAAKAKRKAAHEKFLNQKSNSESKKSSKSSTIKEAVPSAESLSATEYQKKLSSRFPQALSGHITIEQQNLPRRIVIRQDAVVQLVLEARENAFWFTSVNEKVLSVQRNKTENGQTVIILKPIKKGSSRIVLDFISQNGTEYKVLDTKKFNIVVEG